MLRNASEDVSTHLDQGFPYGEARDALGERLIENDAPDPDPGLADD